MVYSSNPINLSLYKINNSLFLWRGLLSALVLFKNTQINLSFSYWGKNTNIELELQRKISLKLGSIPEGSVNIWFYVQNGEREVQEHHANATLEQHPQEEYQLHNCNTKLLNLLAFFYKYLIFYLLKRKEYYHNNKFF